MTNEPSDNGGVGSGPGKVVSRQGTSLTYNDSERSDAAMKKTTSTNNMPNRPSQVKRRRSIANLFNRKLNSSQRNIGLDDEEGKSEFWLFLLIESVEDSAAFFVGSVLVVLVWSILCAWGGGWLRELAESNPGGAAERWVEDIENCKNALSIVGTLFVFTLVFRFNTCYDRWWESRMEWGDIISKSIELGTMNRNWIADEDLADRMSRFIVLFSYSSKALLRGKSLDEDGEDGQDLVNRGLLTREELVDMHANPCWQPHYCLHMIRDILVAAHSVPGGKGLRFDENNKVHGQLFRCFDNTIKDLNLAIGNCIRIRSSGLPATYDAIVMMSYFLFFMIASLVWGVLVGWMSPVIVFCASLVIMFLIVMGSKLLLFGTKVDPFGYDKVDIPLEAFCSTIEAQIYAIDQRGKNGTMRRLLAVPSLATASWKLEGRSSLGRISQSLSHR
ncbi:hypothetical protein ACHAXR_013502 [Thalassiosira sp. AJA248-18]